jgi:hypothetical protein
VRSTDPTGGELERRSRNVATEQAPPSTNVPNDTISRYVIWDWAPGAGSGIERESLIVDLLKKSGSESLRALHGVRVDSSSEFLVEIERLLLQSGLGLIAHAYWPASGAKLVPDSALDQSVEALQLSVRPSNCLLHAGIATVGELLKQSREDLLSLPNMGRKSLDEIYTRLSTSEFLCLEACGIRSTQSAAWR